MADRVARHARGPRGRRAHPRRGRRGDGHVRRDRVSRWPHERTPPRHDRRRRRPPARPRHRTAAPRPSPDRRCCSRPASSASCSRWSRWSSVTAAVQPAVPVRAEHPRHPAQHGDPRGAGGRPGRRGDHPQHRPVGRLGARALRLRRRARMMSADPGTADGRRAAGRPRSSARCAGWSTASLVRFGNVPALVVTLGTLYVFRGISLLLGGRPAGQRRRAAPALPELRQRRRVLGVPVAAC